MDFKPILDVDYYSSQIETIYNEELQKETSTIDLANKIAEVIPSHDLPVVYKIQISDKILSLFSREQRKELAKELLEEQVVRQRLKLNLWSTITAQSAQIDTGYIAQHLVSLQTQISGQGMRGKGSDLSDGAEVKSANFLDSKDKKGAVEPRWNFTAVTKSIMERFLEYPSVYLLSMDYNSSACFRTRIWKVNIQEHELLRNRYIEWMNKLGYKKFSSNKEESVNFQLFPPRSGTEETFARHGNGRKNGFEKLNIELENTKGSELIFRADEINGKIVISKF